MIYLDFETFSESNLVTGGLRNYVSHPSFTPLIAAIGSDGAPTDEYNLTIGFGKSAFSRRMHEILESSDERIVAHNAAFEIEVLRAMGFDVPVYRFLDSAVLAAQLGLHRSLGKATAQLGLSTKLEEGFDLIQLFSIPNETFDFTAPTYSEVIATDNLDNWNRFGDYCVQDVDVTKKLVRAAEAFYPAPKMRHEMGERSQLTIDMNLRGWPVDEPLLTWFEERYASNTAQLDAEFRRKYDPAYELNINSLPQLQAWCRERGVRATSFNEQSVESMLDRIEKKLDTVGSDWFAIGKLLAVQALLQLKQALGGSALKKLEPLRQSLSPDNRLHHQYLHAGAAQTLRTSGRGVQVQNIKRLANQVDFSEGLPDELSNPDLATNMRQLFRAGPGNHLYVMDFSAVESRGLAWLAGAKWKLDNYREGLDMYKVLASKMLDVPYQDVSKDQRQTGKLGELSCGYGAGAGAVSRFAAKMGIDIAGSDAATLVRDWRESNPEVVRLWADLDALLKRGLTAPTSMPLAWDGFTLTVEPIHTPAPLLDQHPGAQSIAVSLAYRGNVLFYRTFHGAYMRGRNVCYYKPSSRKTGPLWIGSYIDPSTQRPRHYDVYGGKLSGILTQSLCREIFMSALERMSAYDMPGVQIIGQFHDEFIIEAPADSLHVEEVAREMSRPLIEAVKLPYFPLDYSFDHAERYIK